MVETIHHSSALLSPEENNVVFNIIQGGHRRNQSLATAVVKFYISDTSKGHREWTEKQLGVACLIKDFKRKSYFIEIINMEHYSKVWEQELYIEMKYCSPEPWFHMFEADSCQAALSFAELDEAIFFKNKVSEKIERHKQVPASPASTNRSDIKHIKITTDLKPTMKKNTKRNQKISKMEISGPAAGSFVHVSGMKPDGSGRMEMVDNSNQLDPMLRDFLLKKLKIDVTSLSPKDISEAQEAAVSMNLYEEIKRGRSSRRGPPRVPSPSRGPPRIPSPARGPPSFPSPARGPPSLPSPALIIRQQPKSSSRPTPPPVPRRDPPRDRLEVFKPNLPQARRELPPSPDKRINSPASNPQRFERKVNVPISKPPRSVASVPPPPPAAPTPPPPPPPAPMTTPPAPKPSASLSNKPERNDETTTTAGTGALLDDIRNWKKNIKLSKAEDRSSGENNNNITVTPDKGGIADVMKLALEAFRDDVGYSSSEEEDEDDDWDSE